MLNWLSFDIAPAAPHFLLQIGARELRGEAEGGTGGGVTPEDRVGRFTER